MKEIQRSKDIIYLIQPNKFTLDVTYGVFARDEYIYFCRCGGQMYTLDFSINGENNCSDEELLAHKKSFRLRKDEIKGVSIDSKQSWWTGRISNGGTIVIETTIKKKFIVHIINSATEVQEFFKNNVDCKIDIKVSPHQEYNEKMTQEFEKQDLKEHKFFKTITMAINITTVLATVWLLFFTEGIVSKKVAVVICSILPVLGFVFYSANSKKVSLVGLTNERRPNIAVAVFVPSIAMSIIALLPVDIRFTWIVGMLMLIATVILTVILIWITKEHRRSKVIFLGFPFLIGIYLFGMVMATNIYLVNDTPQIHNVEVVGKEEYTKSTLSGERKDYSFLIEDWTGEKEFLHALVSKEHYNQTNKGDEVKVYVFCGLWKIEWYLVRSK